MLKYFALLTSSHEGSSLAQRAKREGLDVVTALLQDWTETYTPEEAKQDKKPEDPLDKKRRLKTFSGIVPQTTPEKMLKILEKLSGTEQEQTYVMVDMNYNFKFSEDLLKLNVQGNFPLVENRILESNREAGKNFVKQYYTDLKLTEIHDFKNVQEALDFLEENMQGDNAKLWVLKGNDAACETIVPLNNDTAQQAYATIKTALEKDVALYEGKGFLLEEFIKDAVEITPQCVFYDGIPVYYSCDIELKKKGSGLSGRTTGCAANLVFRTNPEDKINKMAFPLIIYQMAKQHKGLFIWDASVLCNPQTEDYYFGEFCCNRWGFDCTQTEMEMAGGVTKYFEKVITGEAPYDYGKFGFAVRIFNELDDHDVPGHCAEDIPFFVDQEVADHVWPLYVYQDEEGMKSSGYGEDLAVVTCVADSIEAAAQGCYHYMDKIGFKDYSRLSIDDVLSVRSAGTILNRFKYGNDQHLYNVSNGSIIKSEEVMSMKEPIPEITQQQNYSIPEQSTGMRGTLEMLTALANENEGLKKGFGQKLKTLEQDYQEKLSEALEILRNELTIKLSSGVREAKENKEIATALQMVAHTQQDIKNSLSGLIPKEINLTGLEQALALLPGKSESLEQTKYLINISDGFLDLKNGFIELAKQLKPAPDQSGKIIAAIVKLGTQFEKGLATIVKSNKETVTVVGGSGQKYDIPPNLPVIQNITLTSQSTEYPCTLPDGTKRVQFKIRGLNGNTLRYGWNSGDTSGSAYVTLEQGETALISGVRALNKKIIYFNCPDAAAQVVEVETWTS